MNRKLVSIYLKLIGRPLHGLKTLNMITEKEVIRCLNNSKYKINIERMKKYRSYVREEKIRKLLPRLFKKKFIIQYLNRSYELISKIISATRVGREENHIDLWVIKSV